MARALASTAVLLVLAGCGAEATDRALSTRAVPGTGRTLERNGISIAVPAGWDGRVLYREPTGSAGAIFQVANFELPVQEGLEPPPAAPGGDRLEAMVAGDVLVTVLSDEPRGRPLAERVALDDLPFLPASAPRVPAGHALAEGSVCLRAGCFAIAVDFGAGPPDPRLKQRVDQVLASLAVDGPRRIELDGLRLELPRGWHGYSTTIGRHGEQPVIWAGNLPFAERPSTPEFPHETLRDLPSVGVVVAAIAAPSSGPRTSAPFTDGEIRQLELPLTLADGWFLERDYEGQPARHVSTAMIEGRVGRRTLFVQVYFGANEPSAEMRAAADAALASVSL